MVAHLLSIEIINVFLPCLTNTEVCLGSAVLHKLEPPHIGTGTRLLTPQAP